MKLFILMIYKNMNKNNLYKEDLNFYKKIIQDIFSELYKKEYKIFENKLCERCLVFRFAYKLQTIFEKDDYFVDCDYNLWLYRNSNWNWEEKNWKKILNENWTLTKRFIDIIIHKRIIPDEWCSSDENDLICFEIKTIYNKRWIDKDINNLKKLTSTYWYKFWFHIFLWNTLEKSSIHVYHDWEKKEEYSL